MILDELLLTNIKFNEDNLSNNLYISFDLFSALRKDYKLVLEHVKVYDSYEILKEKKTILDENYVEELYLVKTNYDKLFVRIIREENLINDILVYTYNNDLEFINSFFEEDEIKIPHKLVKMFDEAKMALILIRENNKYKILTASISFYKAIKYESFDYANKFLNILDDNMESLSINDSLVKLNMYDSLKNVVSFEFNELKKEDFILWYIN